MKDARLIALVEQQVLRALKAEAKRQKITMAEAARRAITLYLKKK